MFKYNYIVIQLSQDKQTLMQNVKLWQRCGQVKAMMGLLLLLLLPKLPR